jgi:hypothetical protein
MDDVTKIWSLFQVHTAKVTKIQNKGVTYYDLNVKPHSKSKPNTVLNLRNKT